MIHLKHPAFLTLLMLCRFSFGWQAYSDPGDHIYTIYAPEDHGGGTISTEVCQDRHGNLYVGNESGLLKYNGAYWSRMPTTGHASYIMSVAIDDSDRIWVSGLKSIGYYKINKQGSYIYHDVTSSLSRLPSHADLGTFWKLYTHDQYTYLITSQHVLRWDNSEWKVWSFQEQRRILPSWVDNKLYIHARGTGLFQLNENHFKLIAEDTPNVSSGIITVVDHTQSGLLCATGLNGLFLLNEGEFSPIRTDFEVSQILNAFPLSNGSIALSTTEQGILIINNTGTLINQIPNSNAPVYSTFEDNSGSMWAAATGSIIQISNLALTHYSDNAHDIVRHAHKLYYTNGSELKNLPPRNTNKPPVSLLRATTLWDLHSSEDSLLYGNSESLGVFKSTLDRTTISSSRHVASLHSSFANASLLYSNDPPKISRWLKTTEGWEYLGSLAGFDIGALSLTELPNAKLLISNENSPLQLATWPLPNADTQSESTIISLGQEHGLPEKFIWAHCLRIQDWVIVISDKGLYRYDNESETFRYDPVLGSNLGTDAYGLESCPAADNDGWILRLPSADQNQNEVGHLSTTDGKQFEWTTWQLPSLHFAGKVEALLHEKVDGLEVLWIGGSKDLLRYDLTNMPQHPAPRTRLTAIREQDSHQAYFGGAGATPVSFEWDYPQKTLHISYAAVPSPIQVTGYQTRLAGFDQGWSEASDITFRDFTNLSPGSYEFEVRAVDEFGRFGEHAQLSFTILPPWYQTVYAYFGYMMLFIASLIAASRWRLRALRIQNKRLEDLIHERTVDLQEQKLQLIKANNAKQEFLASMSHEIRNPLNGILGIVNLMHDQEEQSGILTPQTKHLFTSANHLHQLLGQTLDYSSLEAGKLRARSEPFEACQLIDQVIDMHLNMAKEKGLHLQSQKPDSPCYWKGDPVLLRQVLINLVSNAIKYTANGSVDLELSYEQGDDSIRAHFEVSDTGPGIPKDREAYIFEEFTRLSKPGESKVPGTGLGLAIAAKVSKLMGGHLGLDSSYTSGARFTLDIELEEDLYTRASNKRQQDRSQTLSNRRVLIADDIEFNRYVSTELLQSMGATVDSAVNGEDALNKLHQNSYDIVILDINMPILSGLEVVEQFSESEPMGNAPEFIALSAYNTLEMEIKSLNAGFDHFMEKPLDPAKFISLFGNRYKTPDDSQGILNYIAAGDQQAQAELESRFWKSFNTELQNLETALTNANEKDISEITHKLIGIASIRKDAKFTALLKQLSKQIRDPEANVDIATIIDELKTVAKGHE